MSLSARRAWIEIIVRYFRCMCEDVALRKESVDRNVAAHGANHAQDGSLSARRAWIEIAVSYRSPVIFLRRSPQGERG